MSEGEFADQVVLVTGAGAGIGRASAQAFARAGAMVLAAGRGRCGLAQTVSEIDAAGGHASAVEVDISDADQVQRMVDEIVRVYGRLDVAHNNAGVLPKPAPLADVDITQWRNAVDVNLNGLFYCLRAEIAAMRSQHSGVIVNTASNIGAHGRRPNMAAYATTKAAVSTLSASAALDHIGDGIRINAVSPGATATRMSLRAGESDEDRAQRLAHAVPAGRVAEVSEVVDAVLWLASARASFVVGHDLVVDGGVTA